MTFQSQLHHTTIFQCCKNKTFPLLFPYCTISQWPEHLLQFRIFTYAGHWGCCCLTSCVSFNVSFYRFFLWIFCKFVLHRFVFFNDSPMHAIYFCRLSTTPMPNFFPIFRFDRWLTLQSLHSLCCGDPLRCAWDWGELVGSTEFTTIGWTNGEIEGNHRGAFWVVHSGRICL